MQRLMILAGAVALAVASTQAQAQNPIPEKFTNLRVLPKDITRAELTTTMKSFAQGLGVRCENCHVGEGNDLSKFDFASDSKAPKGVARRMIQMTAILNAQMANIGEAAKPGVQKITCFTCHRGAAKPLTAPGGGGN